MDYAAVEQDLGSVRDLIKHSQCHIEFVVIVAGEGCHPGFDFLCRLLAIGLGSVATRRRRKARTCFRDMTSGIHLLPGSMVSSSLNPIPSPTTPQLGALCSVLGRGRLIMLVSIPLIPCSRRGFGVCATLSIRVRN
jgi:hypothetical protein